MARKRAIKKVSPLKGRNRTPPYPNYPAWSTSRFFSFLRSALRGAYNRYPPKFEALKSARRKYEGNDKRTKWQFLCSICNEWHKGANVQVDHIVPAGSLNSFDDLPGFVSRLFCSVDHLRVLCVSCHAGVTKAQNSKDVLPEEGINDD